MLRSLRELFGYSVAAIDGPIGKVEDFLFDTYTHDIRYVVVDTGGWLNRRPVLVAAVAFGHPRWPARDFPVKITREQVMRSPELTPDAPPSRQGEAVLHAHYEWLPYWLIHGHDTPTAHVAEAASALCRARQVVGYQARCVDDTFGHLVDFVLEDDHWHLRSAVVETEGWWPPRALMVDMATFVGLDAITEHIILGLTAQQVRESPPYDPAAIGSRENEVQYDYRGRPRM